MGIIFSGSALLLLVGTAAAEPTSWGIRAAPGEQEWLSKKTRFDSPASGTASFDLPTAATLGSKWGTVTSTTRNPARNRAVGGAPNSFHLRSRAIDIARRPGVNHAMIESAYRSAGYRLIESLDEGDHSHFAFGTPTASALKPAKPQDPESSPLKRPTRWRIVDAPARR